MSAAVSESRKSPAPSQPRLKLDGPSLAVALTGDKEAVLERDVLPDFLSRQRWFGAKDSAIQSVLLTSLGEIEAGTHLLAVLDVSLAEGVEGVQRYFLPLSAVWEDDAAAVDPKHIPALASLQAPSRAGLLVDSALLGALDAALLGAMRDGREIGGETGSLVFEGSAALAAIGDPGAPKPLGAEQSNVSVGFGGKVILKLYRRLRAGEQPDVEMARFLTNTARYTGAPPFLGEIRHRPPGKEPTTLAAAFAFVPNQGDAWSAITGALIEDLAAPGDADRPFPPSLTVGALLGRRTAEMHKALAADTDEAAFKVEPLTAEDVAKWAEEAVGEAEAVLAGLERGLSRLGADAAALARRLLENREALVARLRGGAGMEPSGGRSRIHGDYHLGQVLAADGDFVIIDFEGEPRRSLAERRAKSSPLRDVAGMLRSFHYAARSASDAAARRGAAGRFEARAERWRRKTGADFMRGYEEHIEGASSYPTDKGFAQALAELFLLQKALYEIGYELANRPDWVAIPLRGTLDLLERR